MRARVLAWLVTLAACLVAWAAWGEVGRLRGTVFWDLRYVVAGCAVFLVLTLAERVASRFR